jgi:cytochrome c1
VSAAAVLALACAVAGCGTSAVRSTTPQVPGGNPERGRHLISSYGCGSCHTVPGVKRADALVGPPLIHFGRRGYIAGKLPNGAANLERWIQDPQAVVPGNDMPNLGVTPQDAKDITAYLLGLR